MPGGYLNGITQTERPETSAARWNRTTTRGPSEILASPWSGLKLFTLRSTLADMANDMLGHLKPPGERLAEKLIVSIMRRLGSSKKYEAALVHVTTSAATTHLDIEEARELIRLLTAAVSEAERLMR